MEGTENSNVEKGGKMSFLDHLEALRWHIIRSVAVLVITTAVLFIYSDFIFDKVLFGPTKPDFITYRLLCKLSHAVGMGDSFCISTVQFQLINTEMTGQLMMYIWGIFIAALIITIPYLLWEIWRFVSPALSSKELSSARGLVLSASVMFLTGAAFSYFIIVPWALNFLNNFKMSGSSIQNMLNVRSYITTVTTLVIWLGIIFELPVATYILTSLGLITPSLLKKYRRHAIVIILIVAALIAPPDVASQVLVSIPLYLLFEISIFVSAYVVRKKNAKRETTEMIKK